MRIESNLWLKTAIHCVVNKNMQKTNQQKQIFKILSLCFSILLTGCTNDVCRIFAEGYQVKQTRFIHQDKTYVVCRDCVQYTQLN